MQINRNGAKNKTYVGRVDTHNWDNFDGLPRDIKEAIWSSVLNLKVGSRANDPARHNDMRKQLADAKRMQSQSTRATYGADHPQAGITLADLGL